MSYKIDKDWLLEDTDKEAKVVVSVGFFDYSMIEYGTDEGKINKRTRRSPSKYRTDDAAAKKRIVAE